MSPVNSDDSSGDDLGGAGRPLTRKEIRAREKLLATQGHSVIPPQAFETGQDVPTAAAPSENQPANDRPAETPAVDKLPPKAFPELPKPRTKTLSMKQHRRARRTAVTKNRCTKTLFRRTRA